MEACASAPRNHPFVYASPAYGGAPDVSGSGPFCRCLTTPPSLDPWLSTPPRSRFPLTSSPPTDVSARAPPRCARQVEALPAATGTSSAPPTARPRSRTWSARCARASPSCSRLPEGYEVVLGNGGSTAFWDVATHGLIENRSQHLSFGEFCSKFAKAAKRRRGWASPTVISSDPGTHPEPTAEAGVDVYAYTHNETSTGVAIAPRAGRRRRRGRRSSWWTRPPAPAACRSTSPRPTSTTSPRRSPSPPTAACGSRRSRPAAIERAERIKRVRALHVPAFLDLPTAIDNSPQEPDVQHPRPRHALPARRADGVDQRPGRAGLVRVNRTAESSRHAVRAGPRRRKYATPFVADPAKRSQVIGTIDFDDEIDAAAVAKVLRANGDRRHRALPQARPQPAARRDVPGGRARRRRGADGVHRLRSRVALTSYRHRRRAGSESLS